MQPPMVIYSKKDLKMQPHLKSPQATLIHLILKNHRSINTIIIIKIMITIMITIIKIILLLKT